MEGNVWLLWAVAWPFLASFSWAGFCEMGIWLKADGFRWLYSTIAAFMWMMTTLFSMEYFACHGNSGRYCFFSLLTCGATMGVFLSDSLFTLFLFFEIMGLTSFVMVIQEETAAAGRAARTYLAIAVIGGLCALFGIFMIAAGTGNLSMDSLEQFRKATGGTWPLYLAGALLLAGFGAKAGMYPLHVWLPNAHPVAPAPASALLSGILMVTVTMFRHDRVWGMVLLAPGAVTMVLGAILAVFSIDLKRTLACSSMSQIGFILTGCSMQCLLGEENGLAVSGTVLHMVNHSMIKLVLFMAAGCIYMNLHKLDLNEIRGYGRNKPFLMLVFAMGAYGICGIPLWNGYVSKTLLHESIVEYMEMLGRQGANVLPFQVLEWAFLMAGGLTAAYMIKLFAAIFLEKAPLGGSALFLPLMGMDPRRIMDWMADISRPFFRGAHVLHQVEYFSEASLRGACISISMGILVYVLLIRRYLMETGEGGTRIYVDRWPAWLNLEDRVYRPLVLTVLPFLGAMLARCVNGVCEVPLSLFMKKPEKNQVVVPGESSRFFRQAQDVRLLHMIYSSMGYGFMMLGAGLILMTAYVLFL
ncbi:sodium:proton antiporter [Enterocloster clostridioformis]|uniref:complex I subunit 5 family protein n=1 Tax=Enterocloster clostridioformis TaxID=1531 RepID=UPI0009C359E1|nr:sodium:proton antiporter [Lachnoclostridium sp. YL32]NDO31258.1 NADH dehydrogenase [Enterocloster clostridioformis]OXE65457.1 sodium:proton antiporter [Enterocloster clostridioformis]QQR04081.1 NADH dehydrogenase [Enterocloster clostridioformis]